MQGSRVRFDAITKSFGTTVALSKFSLDIEPGEFVTLLGASGSGKTTALNVLAGFSEATAGEIYIDEKPLSHVAPEKRNVGMVFQNFALFPHMTVAQNVGFPLKMRGVDRATIVQKVNAALAMVRLDAFADRKPSALSGGQQQRVALARAVVFEPPVLLMDECLSALDLKLREELQGEIRRIHREVGSTVLFVTHDQTEALTLSDRVAILEGGKIVQIDTPQALYDRPRNRFVANFIGQANIIEVEENKDGKASLRDLGLTIPIADAGCVAVNLRPEQFRFSDNGGSEHHTSFEGVVEDESFFGPIVAHTVRHASGRIFHVRSHRSRHDRQPLVGDVVRLAFDPANAAPLAKN